MKKLLLLGVFMVFASMCFAQGLSEKVQFHGFVSQGFVFSDNNTYLVPGSEQGSLELNEVGLNLAANVSSKLRIGMQLFARDFGETGNNAVKLDWAFADYSFRDYLGIRVGKIKKPFGLYNEGRDTDIIRNTCYLPQSLYSEFNRNFNNAFQGVSLYGNIDYLKSSAGDLDYQLFMGAVNIDASEIPMQNFTNSLSAGGIITQDVKVRSKQIVGGSIMYNSSLPGLKVGSSFEQSKYKYSLENVYVTDSTGNTTELSQEGDITVNARYAISGEYQYNNLLLASEFSFSPMKIKSNTGLTLNETHTEQYYFLASYTMFERYTLTGTYDHSKVTKRTSDYPILSTPDWMDYRNDSSLALRVDITSNWIAKVEGHYVDGIASTYMHELGQKDAPKEFWTYYLAKLTYNF